VADSREFGPAVYGELWVSLASLLRSYTAAHGLNGNRQATVELGEERILVRHGEDWLELERQGATVIWKRADGRHGTLEMTEAGRLRSIDPWSQDRDQGHPKESLDPRSENPDQGHPEEVEMDVAAEAWAREMMR
jgi:hypothetical protein